MKKQLGTWLKWGMLIVLAGVFIHAGALKITAPLALADSIAAYQLPCPGWVISIMALTLPSLEIMAAVLLFGSKSRGPALVMLGILNLFFLAALGQATLRGLVVDCGCFGAGPPSHDGMVRAILRDVLLLGAVVWLYSHELTCKRKDNTEREMV